MPAKKQTKRKQRSAGEAIRESKERFRVRVKASPEAVSIQDANGQIVEWFGATSDVTHGKAAEEALSASERLYHSLVEQLPQAIFRLDRKGRITFGNTRYGEFLGCGLSELLGKTDADLFPPELAAKYWADSRRVMETGEVFEDVEEYVGPDGGKSYVHVIKSPLRGTDGDIIGLQGLFWDVTGRERAEMASRESEERYRLLADNTDDFVTLLDTQENRLYVSPSFFRATGWTAEEVMGSAWDVRLHPEDIPLIKRSRAANLAGQTTLIEFRSRCRDGSWIWVEARTKPIFRPDGRVMQLLICAHDITERKRTELALRASEQKHRLLFESSPDAIMTLAPPDWRYTSANPATLAMFRAGNEADFIAVNPWQLSPEFQPDGKRSEEKAREIIQTVVREGGSHFFEWAHQRLDGEVFPSTVLLTRFELAGQPMLQAAVRDVTEKKRDEAALREREKELSRVLETAATGLARCSRDFRYVWANTSFAKFVGIPLEQIIGMRIVDVVGEAAFELIRPYLDRVLRGERVEHASETPFAHGARYVHAVNTPDVNRDGQIIGWYVCVTDITEQKSLEREVLRTSEAERQRVGAELHDGIFQEIIASSFTAKALQRRLEKEDNPLAPDMGALTHAISQTAARMRQIAHGMDPVVDSADGLEIALREFARVTAERHHLCCQCECASPLTVLDPVLSTQLFRIAQEAVHNAVKHSNATRIELALNETDCEIRLEVTDNGCGLPAGADSGTGFGLRAMRYRAGLIHGILVIQNRAGGGTEVTCRVTMRHPAGHGPSFDEKAADLSAVGRRSPTPFSQQTPAAMPSVKTNR